MEGSGESGYSLADYDYMLPDDLIAQVPNRERDSSRLLVLNRTSGSVEHRRFDEITSYLRPGDLLVANNTKVVPARLLGRKETGGRVELLVLDPYKPAHLGESEGYCCLIKASKSTRPQSVIELAGGARARLLTSPVDGKAQVQFLCPGSLLDLLEQVGHIPLPPYIRREGDKLPSVDDSAVYQTVYARNPGAVAAPTAGLHFTEGLLGSLKSSGVELTAITLHVGYGTFAPIRVEDIREHSMHEEYVEVSPEAAESIAGAKREGRRVIAVGTTAVRTLEWVALKCGGITATSGLCNHYIYPGYRFRIVDSMITNFHLPKSTLLLLVSAFAGRRSVLSAYDIAVANRYRFFSYGDAMLIL